MPSQSAQEVGCEDEGTPASDNESAQGNKQWRKATYSWQVCQRMGELLQAGGYEKDTQTAGWMDEKPDPDGCLETMEESKNPIC